MTDKTRDKIIAALISIGASLIILVVGFWLTGLRLSNEDLDLRIDSKVDQIQYMKDCDVMEKRILNNEKMLESYKKDSDELFRVLYGMKEQLGRIETDVNWLKKKTN